ncbi:hypothetical protein pb186bvf_010430 [Paramecium bursaria]
MFKTEYIHRSSSTYTQGFPKMKTMSPPPFMFSFNDRFAYRTPPSIKASQVKIKLHQNRSQIMAELQKQLNRKQSKPEMRKSQVTLNSLLLTKRSTQVSLSQQERVQVLWDSVQAKLQQQGINPEDFYDLFTDLLKPTRYLMIDRYDMHLDIKYFRRLRGTLIQGLLSDGSIQNMICKLQQLKEHIFQKKNLYQQLRGIDGINKIIQSLIKYIREDITLCGFIQDYSQQEIQQYFVDIINDIIQPQEKIDKITQKITNFVNNNQINHIHYCLFKYIVYRVLLEREFDMKTIQTILKIIDWYKVVCIRQPGLRQLIGDDYNYFIGHLIYDKKNVEGQKKQIELLMDYIFNNYRRGIKYKDVQNMNLNINLIRKTALQFMNRYHPSHMLLEQFKQELDILGCPKYKPSNELVTRFTNQIMDQHSFTDLYKENDIDGPKLLQKELDFIMNNRSYFRYSELKLIHRPYNISNEKFDFYIMNFQASFKNGPLCDHLVERINSFREYIVSDNK